MESFNEQGERVLPTLGSSIRPEVFERYASRFHFMTHDISVAEVDAGAGHAVVHQGVYVLKRIRKDWWGEGAPWDLVPRNRNLYMIREAHLSTEDANHGLASGAYELDDGDFTHEDVLVVEHAGGLVVVSGCSHNGFVNIVKAVQDTFRGKPIWAFVGGLHFCDSMSLVTRDVSNQQVVEPAEHIYEVACQLWSLGVGKVYTGHCTGVEGFEILQQSAGEDSPHQDCPEFVRAMKSGFIEYLGVGCGRTLWAACMQDVPRPAPQRTPAFAGTGAADGRFPTASYERICPISRNQATESRMVSSMGRKVRPSSRGALVQS